MEKKSLLSHIIDCSRSSSTSNIPDPDKPDEQWFWHNMNFRWHTETKNYTNMVMPTFSMQLCICEYCFKLTILFNFVLFYYHVTLWTCVYLELLRIFWGLSLTFWTSRLPWRILCLNWKNTWKMHCKLLKKFTNQAKEYRSLSWIRDVLFWS